MSDRIEQLKARMASRGLRACPNCAGRRLFAGRVGFEQAEGSPTHGHDLVICARCGKAEVFVDDEPERWVKRRVEYNPFVEYEVPESGPCR